MGDLLGCAGLLSGCVMRSIRPLRLEALEDRTAPATITPVSVPDAVMAAALIQASTATQYPVGAAVTTTTLTSGVVVNSTILTDGTVATTSTTTSNTSGTS